MLNTNPIQVVCIYKQLAKKLNYNFNNSVRRLEEYF